MGIGQNCRRFLSLFPFTKGDSGESWVPVFDPQPMSSYEDNMTIRVFLPADGILFCCQDHSCAGEQSRYQLLGWVGLETQTLT